jgi:hypothetical protein
VNADTLTVTQLMNIFPEFKDRLNVYEMCCDGNGKIVRNFEVYNMYKKKPHFAGKRGSKQD